MLHDLVTLGQTAKLLHNLGRLQHLQKGEIGELLKLWRDGSI